MRSACLGYITICTIQTRILTVLIRFLANGLFCISLGMEITLTLLDRLILSLLGNEDFLSQAIQFMT